jgi:TOMM system kinase/cyclase fusion protein
MDREAAFEESASSTVARLRLAGYDVKHSVGAGSGGQVYKAEQLSTGQAVAIKLLKLSELEPEHQARRVERFRREITFCSALYHPDIVRLLDSGALDDGTRFAVFEYIPGKTLAEVLRDEGMLKVQRARHLMTQLLPPLAYAHAKGIAHRDLKPGNIMVTNDGGRDRLKILDFGISISTAPDEAQIHRLTQSHEWVCTPIYAAPEQLRGEASGPKSDLYAWALIFVECLTGSTLISGRSLAEVVAQQLHPTPHALPLVLAHHRLGALLLRVLEKDASRRLGEAQALFSLLERISTESLENAHGYLKETTAVGIRSRPGQGLTDTVTDSEPPEQTEQRHVTAVCCRVNLVGTGALSSVEELDALLDDSYAWVSEILLQFGATTGQSVGGYSLWYFGLSQTRDAHARLAVRAALEIVNRIEKLPGWFGQSGLALAVQVGVHNGPVTVQLSEGRRTPVDGLTARVAVQLATLETKSPGDTAVSQILVSEDFRELVARHVDVEQLDDERALRLPWRSSPLRGFRLTGESRSTTLRSERAPFVGRAAELEVLSGAWRRSGTGQGSAVLISGEPGIGKSRLAAELMYRLDSEGCRALEARCLPEWQNASLRPLAQLLTQSLGLAGASRQEAAERIERKLIELGLNAAMAVPLFCVWLSLELPQGYVPLTWSPQKQRQLLHHLVADALIAMMERGAALLIEDIHWADPSTLECLDTLLTRAKDRSALIVLTSRPGLAFTAAVAPEHLVLSRLDDDSVRTLATALLPESTSDQIDLSQLIARCDGIPLYLEELAFALKSVPPSLAPVPALDARGPVALPSVPPSLRDLLTSRLEEIEAGKETVQFAAALGREFSLEMLSTLSLKDELTLAGDLEELVTAQILVKRLRLDSSVYIFRHALIRDAAYDSMQLQTRQRVHAKIAEGLERTFPQLAEVEPDVVAHHYDRAGNDDKAIRFWQLAAKKSNASSAHLEAIAHIDRSIELLTRTPPPNEILEAELLLTRGAILVAKRGYTDPAAKRCFERITELVPAQGETLQLAFGARWCLWYYHNTCANLKESSTLADELCTLSKGAEDSALRLSAWTAICESRFCTGLLEEAVAASRSCAAEYVFERHRYLALSYGDDPHLASTAFESLAELLRGRYAIALERVEEGIALAERLGFPALQAGMQGQAAWVYLNWGSSGSLEPNLERARHHAGLAMKLSQEHGFPFWEIYGKLIDSAARIAAGDVSAVADLQQCAAFWQGAGAKLGRCWHLTFIAQGMRRAGDFAGALAAYDEALEFCEAHESRYFESEVRRQRAELLADALNPARDIERARTECLRAAREASKLGAHWWQLASLVTAVRIRTQPGDSALGELAQLLTRFPSTPVDPPLLAEARKLAS